MNEHRLLHELLPYRMQVVNTLNLAIRMRLTWPNTFAMCIHVNGKLVVEGNLNAFTNPVIEAGLVHCRCVVGVSWLVHDAQWQARQYKQAPRK